MCSTMIQLLTLNWHRECFPQMNSHLPLTCKVQSSGSCRTERKTVAFFFRAVLMRASGRSWGSCCSMKLSCRSNSQHCSIQGVSATENKTKKITQKNVFSPSHVAPELCFEDVCGVGGGFPQVHTLLKIILHNLSRQNHTFPRVAAGYESCPTVTITFTSVTQKN